jgi:pimeloyl-ACP methyl ester carboxylesterase
LKAIVGTVQDSKGTCQENNMNTLFSQNVKTYVKDEGAGSPILFLHGAPDSAEMWNGVIRRLSSHYRCLAPDLPGFGRSVASANFDYSLDSQAVGWTGW